MRLHRRFVLPSVCLACTLLAACSPARETVAPVTSPSSSADSAALRVRADQALRPALEPLVRDYEARTKQRISLSFAPAAQVRAWRKAMKSTHGWAFTKTPGQGELRLKPLHKTAFVCSARLPSPSHRPQRWARCCAKMFVWEWRL